MVESTGLDFKDDGTLSISDLGGVVVNVLREGGKYAVHFSRTFADGWLSYYGAHTPTRQDLVNLYDMITSKVKYEGIAKRAVATSKAALAKAGNFVVDSVENLYLAAFRAIGIKYDEETSRHVSLEVDGHEPMLNIQELSSSNPRLKQIAEDPRWQNLKPWDRKSLVEWAIELLDYRLFGSTVYDRFGGPYIKADFRSGVYTPLNGGMPDDLAAVMQLANIKKLGKLQL